MYFKFLDNNIFYDIGLLRLSALLYVNKKSRKNTYLFINIFKVILKKKLCVENSKTFLYILSSLKKVICYFIQNFVIYNL